MFGSKITDGMIDRYYEEKEYPTIICPDCGMECEYDDDDYICYYCRECEDCGATEEYELVREGKEIIACLACEMGMEKDSQANGDTSKKIKALLSKMSGELASEWLKVCKEEYEDLP